MDILFNNNRPFIEGVSVDEITKSFSTPLYIYSQKKIEDAYKITGKIVAYAEKNNKMLNELTLKDFQKFDNKINKNIFTVLSSINSVKSKKSYGGTSPENVKKSISKAIKRYL